MLEENTNSSEKAKDTEGGSANSLERDEEKSENTIELSGVDSLEIDIEITVEIENDVDVDVVVDVDNFDVEAVDSNDIPINVKIVELESFDSMIETKV